jgi:hypothetical protein
MKLASNVSLLTLLFVSTILLTTFSGIQGSPVQSPFRLRFSAEFLKKLMLKKDHELLELFHDIDIGTHTIDGDFKINSMKASIVPAKVELENYHHDISFDELNFFGLEGNNLKFVGKANEGDLDELEVEGVVSKLKLEFELIPQPEQNYTYTSKEISVKSFEFKVDPADI